MPRRQTARDTVEDLPVNTHHHLRSRPSADVALLAGTALGFASMGKDETHARRLLILAHPHPGSLPRAQTAVLVLEIGSARERSRAAGLLGGAARLVADPHGAVLHSEAAAFTGVPLSAAVAAEGQR